MANKPQRPGGLDLRSHSFEPPQFPNSTLGSNPNASMSNLSLMSDLPSPRTGEAPPALSPLDALALQGRLLAKRFEQQDKAGRRLSRLAPLTIQNEFGNRSGYFSSMSSSTVNSPNEEAGPVRSPQPQPSPRQDAHERHKSCYPQFGNEEPEPQFALGPLQSPMATIVEASPATPPQGYFDIPRSHSPDSVEPHFGLREATPISPHVPQPTSHMFLSPQRKPSVESQHRSQPRSNLLPPRSSSSIHSNRSPRLSPSMRSVTGDSYGDVEDMSLSGSYDSIHQNRNLSPSSSVSRAHSPFAHPGASAMARSPSAASDYSQNGSILPRPSYNFSRPMSRQSARPSLDARSNGGPSRQPSQESVNMRPSFDSPLRRQDSGDSPTNHYANDTIHTPVSMASEDFRRSGDFNSNPAPSYTYTKFNLPRGRPVDRRSVGVEDFFKREIKWDQENQPGKAQTRPPSPESPPRSFDQARLQRPSTDHGAPSLTSSNSTIRARTAGSTAEVTAQQHCDMGLELHEAGELLKSTYHLRLAARAGLPEAMFWYGLACRHGWGMRENKAEALQWLRRAVDSGQLEVADDEDQDKQGQLTDLTKKKKHRAQYAVAIYELGKCYGNGWGAPTDKSLALRCYEIAGNWGDADALVEAGYCYAEGVGCKKNMKKAAKFYRAAEAKGVSMVGNSWIYKDKYMDDDSTTSDARSVRSGRSATKDHSEKKPRDKSRTRTIFGRKKSSA
ncbi:TPR repeat SEL1 subfamily [Pyrenophora tritici-repentis]|uniref:SEL1 subprotein n=1 Tax=Pyrenophora tritici-repentis TaxID=45151 RepID=A0A2W1DT85_9PLEO|nr:TPR repeat SEL1 subfamily [Pyrenophora tritici-repentis]KAF7446136.1 TPR repeat SEL1 subfamily [Pyrenophora tritici-repentis]KAF7567241.1 TPR repeat, SEL1 subfamily [Pyrenophora tritici-repentis]KAG9381841.1 TPR repeat SEL1 subfamily [Pyrenophora tritici-repentis]KAI0588424.1 TPR repeat SEL1 subfamily [Pyrenophora tritici-repentis]